MTETYRLYLQSRDWASLKQDALRHYGEGCQVCENSVGVQIHHLFYPTPITSTKVEHVMPLCWKCHKAAHASRFSCYVYKEACIEQKRAEVIRRLKPLALGETFIECVRWQQQQPERQLAIEQADRERMSAAHLRRTESKTRRQLEKIAQSKCGFYPKQIAMMSNTELRKLTWMTKREREAFRLVLLNTAPT